MSQSFRNVATVANREDTFQKANVKGTCAFPQVEAEPAQLKQAPVLPNIDKNVDILSAAI